MESIQYTNHELDLGMTLAPNWGVIEDRDILVDEFGMSNNDVENMPMVLLKRGEQNFTHVAYVTYEGRLLPTKDDYEKALADNIAEIEKSGSKLFSRSNTFTQTGDPIAHITWDNGKDDDGVPEYVSQYYIYTKELLLAVSTDVTKPGDEADREVMNMVLSMKYVGE